MATEEDFETLKDQQAVIQALYQQIAEDIVRLKSGTRNDAASFDKDGKPSTDSTHGDLGYYPVRNASGGTTYQPCPDRMAAFAEDQSGPIGGAGDKGPVGDKGPPGDKGPNGSAGPDGSVGLSAFGLVNIGDRAGRLGGTTGYHILTEVSDGPNPFTMENQASVVLPKAGNAAALLYCEVLSSGMRITLGAANAPLPQPPGPDDPLDLGGPSIVYAPFGEAAALNIRTNGAGEDFIITLPDGIAPIATRATNVIWTPTDTFWDIAIPSNVNDPTNHPWPSQDAGLSGVKYLNYTGDNAHGDPVYEYVGGAINAVTLSRNNGFGTESLGLNFPDLPDAFKTRTPHRLRIDIVGSIPNGDFLLAVFGEYGAGTMTLGVALNGGLNGDISRAATGSRSNNASDQTRPYTGVHKYSIEWIDDPAGDGGFVKFYLDDVQKGDTLTAEIKLRIDPGAALYINNSYGNYGPSKDGYYFKAAQIGFDLYGEEYVFTPISSGPIGRTDIERLFADARAITEQQPSKVIQYAATGGPTSELTVVVGDVLLPAGRAYKVVLEDWSTGEGVAHPNELVMTKFVAQNCRVEDSIYFAEIPAWSECIPQGPVPVIDAIAYHCEAIRTGNYVQMQFGYEWADPSFTNAPFGDPAGFVSYMVPHKWLIYDQDGTLLHRMEKPNGSPLNSPEAPNVFEGPWAYGSAKIGTGAPWYPSGTVHMGLIWRSHDLEDHDQDIIDATFVKQVDDVPYAMHSYLSNNGLDLRLYGGNTGNSGQINGYSSWNVMPKEQTPWATLVATAGETNDPYTGGHLYEAYNLGVNSMCWWDYSAFNICGRSPTTGPGGGRDDRQIVPEVVAQYVISPGGARLHDGAAFREMAIAYMTSYVSEPYHGFENGRRTPLYKGSARRAITARTHYYGAGEGTTPPERAWYVQGGRIYDVQTNLNPLRVPVPNKGFNDHSPTYSLFQIDDLHAHQFPGWGSLLWKTPEFGMLQVAFWDQRRLYSNALFGTQYSAGEWTQRSGAWQFMHIALAWKTASATSTRLYSRDEVFDFAVFDIEYFYDNFYASNPGFMNPPTDFNVDANISNNILYAAVAKFGAVCYYDTGVHLQGFMGLYWLGALCYAQKIGFIDALRARSAKASAVIDWIIGRYRLSIVNALTQTTSPLCYYATDYLMMIWSVPKINASGGDMTAAGPLPQDWATLEAAYPPGGPDFDHVYEYSDGISGTITNTYLRNGDATDFLLAGPSMLKYGLGLTGSDLDAAEVVANNRRNARKTAEAAKGANAGTEFFTYSKKSFQPIQPPA